MKKLIIAFIALTVLASAQYETFVSKTGNPRGKATLVYFGEYKNFVKDASSVKKYVAANGMNGAFRGLSASSQALAQGLLTNGLQAGAGAAGVGIIIGILDPYVMDLWADKTYYMIKRYGKGSKVSFKKVLLVSDRSISASQAKNIMNKK